VSSDGDLGVVVETERLIVRPWHPDEADRLFDVLSRMDVVRGLGPSARPLKERAEAVALIERWTAGYGGGPTLGAWAIIERSSAVPAGTVLLRPAPDGDGEIEIGWSLHPDSWGKGLATEAASAVLGRAFAAGLQEVWTSVLPDNDRSAAVCRRIGTRLLGLSSRWYHEPGLIFWAGARDGQEPSLAPDALAAT
jgi:RimJ/RimL family protein N-acetyltransferase